MNMAGLYSELVAVKENISREMLLLKEKNDRSDREMSIKMLKMQEELESMTGSRGRSSVKPSDVVDVVTDVLSSVAPTKRAHASTW